MSTIGAIPRRQKPPEEDALTTRFNFLFEHSCLTIITSLVCLAAVGWLAAVSTDFWVVVVGGMNGILLSDEDSPALVFLWSYSGLWRRCDVFTNAQNLTVDRDDGSNYTVDANPASHVTHCHHHLFLASNPADADGRPSTDFVRAELTVVIVVLVLMALAVGFSVYALVHPRYMYKRVAGALHIITAVTLTVLLGLVKSSGHLAHHNTHPKILETSQHYYGYSYLLAVTVLLIFMSAGSTFICYSKKRRDLLYDADMVLKWYSTIYTHYSHL